MMDRQRETDLETLLIMMGFGMKAVNDYLRDGRSNPLPIANVKCEDAPPGSAHNWNRK